MEEFMCGISGIYDLQKTQIRNIKKSLSVMNSLQNHRGPDGSNVWINKLDNVGFGHNRLSIIDLETGTQPLTSGRVTITYNGEIYNYKEIKLNEEKKTSYVTTSDTEVILQSYKNNGIEFINNLRGMFAFAIYDDADHSLLLVRDRIGIKPLYYFINDNLIYFASEIKALLPFLDSIETDENGLKDYLDFQFIFGTKTLFKSVSQLEPGHYLFAKNGKIKIERYWDINYSIDFLTPESTLQNDLRSIFSDSIEEHLVSDVPLGSYLSGGLDSSIVTVLSSRKSKMQGKSNLLCFTGKYTDYKGYDESHYSKLVCRQEQLELIEIDIDHSDFIQNIEKIIYHLDHPIAGPGVIGQFLVAKHASKYRKAILGGQGGDEIFGGYVRYLIAYLEQAIKGEIEGTSESNEFVLTLSKTIKNLEVLDAYKPLMKKFWSKGLFDSSDSRYLSLVYRGETIKKYFKFKPSNQDYNSEEEYYKLYNSDNFIKESYFDKMTHFDFKTLLPALLHVEDRMSMASGIESRVPFLDHRIIEFAAKIPANFKFKDGKLKEILRESLGDVLPLEVKNRKDKMGFPIPLNKWFKNELKDYIINLFDSRISRDRNFFENDKIIDDLDLDLEFSRDLWALLSLELWFRNFHDKSDYFKNLIKSED
jgi:asparagine synthase (glutamine-hydrolysing)